MHDRCVRDWRPVMDDVDRYDFRWDADGKKKKTDIIVFRYVLEVDTAVVVVRSMPKKIVQDENRRIKKRRCRGGWTAKRVRYVKRMRY